MIHRNRGNRRKQDWRKAERKKRICEEYYGFPWYADDGRYKKGKIHCSCAMCTAKTNASYNKSNGPVCYGYGPAHNGSRATCTNNRYGKKNYSISDRKKIDAMRAAVYDCVL